MSQPNAKLFSLNLYINITYFLCFNKNWPFKKNILLHIVATNNCGERNFLITCFV
uniref:Uncharacterized protein n=1 Tax=Anguilla anguilla TaxID=7936 RepID=A0A0E9XDE8_ANGAN